MNRTFSTIEQYIESFENEKQNILWEILHIIRHVAPLDTIETISYMMPTFRYNGNLIHFALFKNHLGLYPGPDAIIHFMSELQIYKTSKGTIQFPLDKTLPKKLIEDIVLYNANKVKDKKSGKQLEV